MRQTIKSLTIWISIITGGILILFSAVQLPFLEVVRKNIESGVDADAYFYSEVSDFQKYEEGVRTRNRESNRTVTEEQVDQ